MKRLKEWGVGVGIEKVIKAMTLAEALEALKAHGEQAEMINGGTDLMVKIKEDHLDPGTSVIVDISDVAELRGIAVEHDCIRIGGAVKFVEVVEDRRLEVLLKGLWDACHSVGAPQIRCLGTLGGNIANGSPAADSVPPLMALGTELVLASLEGERRLAMTDFFVGKGKTALKRGEILKDIIIPMANGEKRLVEFEKLGLRNALAISRISMAVCIKADRGIVTEAGVASGSIGLTAMREKELEEFLVCKRMDDATIDEACTLFSGVVAERLKGRSTAPFKQEAVKGVLRKALERVFATAHL